MKSALALVTLHIQQTMFLTNLKKNIMKNKLNKFSISFLSVLAIAICFVSCQDDDSIARRGKPALRVANNTMTVTEGETAVFDINVEYPLSEKIDIRIDILDQEGNPVVTANPSGGDATTGNGFYDRVVFDDIEVPYPTWFESGWFDYGYLGGSGYVASFPPYTDNIQLNIETILNVLPQSSRSVTLRLTSTSLMAASINEVITVNIEDFVGEDLITRLNWAGDYLESGADACDIDAGLDLDLELIFGGAYIQTSYNDCPEQLTILGSDDDGTYTVDASFWTANGNTSSEGMNIPVSIEFIKPGVFAETVDLSALFPLNDGGLSDGNGNAITSFTVEKTGTTYTVTDSNNTQVAQGRMSVDDKRALKNR